MPLSQTKSNVPSWEPVISCVCHMAGMCHKNLVELPWLNTKETKILFSHFCCLRPAIPWAAISPVAPLAICCPIACGRFLTLDIVAVGTADSLLHSAVDTEWE